ncbi:hypothetical protein MNBD_GAMMA16-1921, partial [hydrothermal vent metagenome]
FQMLFLDKPVDFKEIFVIGGIFSLAGIPIYLVLIMPVYSILLKVIQFPIVVTFPSAATIIMLLLFAFFTTKEWKLNNLYKLRTALVSIWTFRLRKNGALVS